ncbi:hypothetical protein WJX81_001040 [Elliptochloris bilobata]|uniref:THH1/TOM1/TOM3 domain-containing protein n=1 Tax=Elliptochloris bilobata TaxID=381761 RepID=A0AAW1SJM0_9CHLO
MANPGYIVAACNGQSLAGAAVVAALFFVLMLTALGNLLATRYPLYIVLTASGLLRGLGYAFQAVYITKCASPEGQGGYWGAWLAITNAGFGVAIVAQCLILAAWLSSAGCKLAPSNKKALVLLAQLLILAQLCFGPIAGVIASGLVYGGDDPRLWAAGDRLLHASIYGTFGVVVVYTLLCARVVLHALSAYRRVRSSEAPPQQPPAKGGACAGAQPTRGSLLVGVLLAYALLLLMASCVRVSELYRPLLWHHQLWYPLAALPELLALALLLCRPGLVARIGTADRAPLPIKAEDVELGGSASAEATGPAQTGLGKA